MSEETHIVRFDEITPHEVHVTAKDDADAVAIVEHMLKTLSPAERAKTFLALKTRTEHFTAEPIRKNFAVKLEARAIYAIDVEARDAAEAEQKAEDIWAHCGPEDFKFDDFVDVQVEAEEAYR